MATNHAHVTIAMIAAAAGVARSTVSYALRDDPKIPVVTASRVRAVAARLGYRPNPRVAVLMAHIRRGRPVAQGERIAFLWLHAPPGVRVFPVIWEGARRRAEQLGYALEEFWLDQPGLSPARLGQIIRARGITGLLLSPILEGQAGFTINWDWGQFAPAIIGNATCVPELHHAGHHHFAGMRAVMLALQARGLRRIAALIDRDVNDRAKLTLSAAFIAHHPAPSPATRWLHVQAGESVAGLAAWVSRIRPEALVTTCRHADAIKRQRPRALTGVTVVVLDRPAGDCAWAGLDQCEEVIAANAVDLVVGQLHRNERGAPEDVKMLLFPGHWVEAGAGITVPLRIKT